MTACLFSVAVKGETWQGVRGQSLKCYTLLYYCLSVLHRVKYNPTFYQCLVLLNVSHYAFSILNHINLGKTIAILHKVCYNASTVKETR